MIAKAAAENGDFTSNHRNDQVTHLAELLDLQTSLADDAASLTLVNKHAHVDLIAAVTGAVLKACLQ